MRYSPRVTRKRFLRPKRSVSCPKNRAPMTGSGDIDRLGGRHVGVGEVDAAATTDQCRCEEADDRDLEPVEDPNDPQSDDHAPVKPRPRKPVEASGNPGLDRPELSGILCLRRRFHDTRRLPLEEAKKRPRVARIGSRSGGRPPETRTRHGMPDWAAPGPRPHRGPSAPSCLLTPAPGPCQPRPGRGSWLPVHPRWGELMKTGPLRLAAGTACTDGVLFRCFRG